MIRDIQEQIKEWAEGNFGTCPAWQPLLGLQEEVGELSHAYLKRSQAIKLHENHDENIKDAVGDIFIFLCNFCNREGLDLQSIVEKTWGEVKQRDYRAPAPADAGCSIEKASAEVERGKPGECQAARVSRKS